MAQTEERSPELKPLSHPKQTNKKQRKEARFLQRKSEYICLLPEVNFRKLWTKF
jgi:hypothetical protein